MLRSLLCLSLLAVAPTVLASDRIDAPLPYQLSASMQQHRFFIDARAPSGQALRLFTDTGGGMLLTTSGADKLGLEYGKPSGPNEPAGKARWPNYDGPWVPPPKSAASMELAIMVPPEWMAYDGMLGAQWFGDRNWEFDYRAGTLRLLPDGMLPKAEPAHVVKLGFQEDQQGRRATHFARIPARIDGEDLQFLFDTGATFRLDEAAAGVLGDSDVRQRAGSFINLSVLQRWRERHPDWRYLDKGDGEAAMILVPDIEIAGYHSGPTWFSARPDKAFREYMAQWMDQPVDGALGGNAFRTFRITADYPSATAVFEQ